MKVWTAITINHSQCGWGNIGLIHSVVALQIPLSVRALFDWSKQERFESWHTRAHSAEHPVMRGGTVLGRHCSSEPAHWGHFSHILSICDESVFKSPKWLFYRLEGCINILCVYAHTECRVNCNHRKVARPSNIERGLCKFYLWRGYLSEKQRVSQKQWEKHLYGERIGNIGVLTVAFSFRVPLCSSFYTVLLRHLSQYLRQFIRNLNQMMTLGS